MQVPERRGFIDIASRTFATHCGDSPTPERHRAVCSAARQRTGRKSCPRAAPWLGEAGREDRGERRDGGCVAGELMRVLPPVSSRGLR